MGRPVAPANRPPTRSVHHLYVHVPFCRGRCDYCDFFSLAVDPGAAAGAQLLDRYLDALLAELELERQRLGLRRLRTVFLGGGTPSLLGVPRLERLLRALEPLLTPAAEVTVETNPEDVDSAYAAWAAGRGLRVSLGVQSFDRDLRRTLGRSTVADPLAAMALLREAGCANCGVDLIYGIPAQDMAALARDLAVVCHLRPEHVSWYELSVEPGTPLAARLADGDVERGARSVDVAARSTERGDDGEGAADRAAEMQRAIVRRLERAGYRWYEVSNYALAGRQCRHNSAVWRGEQYVGLGPAAVSTLGEHRRRNLPDVEQYLRVLAWPAGGASAGAPPREEEVLSAPVRARERLLLAARTGARVPLTEVAPVLERAVVPSLVRAGLVGEAGGTLWITRKGRMVANAVCVRLFRDSYVKGTTCR